MLDVREPAGRCFFLLGWALRNCKRIDYPIHRMKPTDLQSTAYHEAGHTIVALYYGCNVDEVRLHNPLEGIAYTGGHSMGWFMDETFPAEGEMLDHPNFAAMSDATSPVPEHTSRTEACGDTLN